MLNTTPLHRPAFVLLTRWSVLNAGHVYSAIYRMFTAERTPPECTDHFTACNVPTVGNADLKRLQARQGRGSVKAA